MAVTVVVNLNERQGRTTTAVLLASQLADAGQRTLLLDTAANQAATEWARAAGELPCAVAPRVDTHDLLYEFSQLHFPQLVIDTDTSQPTVRAAVQVADLVLVPTRPTLDQLDRLGPTIDLIADAEVPYPRDLRILFTHAPDHDHDGVLATMRAFLARLGLPVCRAEIPRWEPWEIQLSALSSGRPVEYGRYRDLFLELYPHVACEEASDGVRPVVP